MVIVLLEQGRGWKPGEVRARLADLIEKHQSVPKRAAFVYDGPSFGDFESQLSSTVSLIPAKHDMLNIKRPMFGMIIACTKAMLHFKSGEVHFRHAHYHQVSAKLQMYREQFV